MARAGGVQQDRFLASLAVRKPQHAALEIHIGPAQAQDLAQPRAGEQQQPNGRRGVLSDRYSSVLRLRRVHGLGVRLINLVWKAVSFRFANRIAEAVELSGAEEPVLAVLAKPLDSLRRIEASRHELAPSTEHVHRADDG
jgi:hypothetical protein